MGCHINVRQNNEINMMNNKRDEAVFPKLPVISSTIHHFCEQDYYSASNSVSAKLVTGIAASYNSYPSGNKT